MALPPNSEHFCPHSAYELQCTTEPRARFTEVFLKHGNAKTKQFRLNATYECLSTHCKNTLT